MSGFQPWAFTLKAFRFYALLRCSPPPAIAADHFFKPNEPALFHALFGDSEERVKVNLTPLNRTRFNAIADASVAEVAKTESQQQAYLDRTKAAGKKPETAVLQRFANYRELVMTANARKLHMRLGPNGWKAVRDHVNGPIQAKYGSTAH